MRCGGVPNVAMRGMIMCGSFFIAPGHSAGGRGHEWRLWWVISRLGTCSKDLRVQNMGWVGFFFVAAAFHKPGPSPDFRPPHFNLTRSPMIDPAARAARFRGCCCCSSRWPRPHMAWCAQQLRPSPARPYGSEASGLETALSSHQRLDCQRRAMLKPSFPKSGGRVMRQEKL